MRFSNGAVKRMYADKVVDCIGACQSPILIMRKEAAVWGADEFSCEGDARGRATLQSDTSRWIRAIPDISPGATSYQ